MDTSCDRVMRGGKPVSGVVALLATVIVIAASTGLRAHEVDHAITREGAVVVHLDEEGVPFARESYQVFRPGEDTPFQTGRTDAQGRLAFLPDRTGAWRVRAFSEDGHGVDLAVPVDRLDAAPATGVAGGGIFSGAGARAWGITAGVAAILVIFGGLWMLLRSRGVA